jgi:hypothetical protein
MDVRDFGYNLLLTRLKYHGHSKKKTLLKLATDAYAKQCQFTERAAKRQGLI